MSHEADPLLYIITCAMPDPLVAKREGATALSGRGLRLVAPRLVVNLLRGERAERNANIRERSVAARPPVLMLLCGRVSQARANAPHGKSEAVLHDGPSGVAAPAR